MKIEMFQSVRLITGERGTIVEIFNDGEGYMIDIRLPDDTYETRTIFPNEIATVFTEVETAFTAA